MRARTNHPADPPFEHGIHHPESEWGLHAQQLDRSADYGDGGSDRYADDRERYRHALELSDYWRHEGDVRERARYHQGMYGDPRLWQRVKGAFSGKGPKNYVRSDERIHEDVCEHLTHHPYVDASDIEVTVRDGEVTLSGTVDARMVKRAAEDVCEHVRGVKDVHNYLRVRPQEAETAGGIGPGRP
jgi:osmotically-inducible protein OsmY